MERRDDSLSTRDLAGTTPEAPADEERFEREPATGDAGTTDRTSADAVAGTTATETREPAQRTATADVEEAGSLLPDDEESDFRARWEQIQTRFVDDPRQAVEDADALVAGVMQRIADGFAQARDGLEGQWSRGEDVGTEELRVALQRYRAFFRRLLSA
jgi:hypothetical protein